MSFLTTNTQKGHYEDAPTDPLGRKWINDEG